MQGFDWATFTGVLFTIAVWTYLYKENPIWRLAEHIYIGLATAWSIGYYFYSYVKPTIMDDILTQHHWLYIVPVVLGLMMYLRYFPSVAWLARYPMAFWVGYGAGYGLAFSFAPMLTQVTRTFVQLNSFNNIVLWLAVVTGLMYFFFTVNRENAVVKYGSLIGRYFIMVGLGAAFGNTVLYRYNLFIDRARYVLGFLHLGG